MLIMAEQNNEQFHALDICSDAIKKTEGLLVKKIEGAEQNNEQFHTLDICSYAIKKTEGLLVKKTEGLIKRKNHNCPCLSYVLYNSYT